MGNTESFGDERSGSEGSSSKSDPISENLQLVKERADVRFGDIQIFKEKNTDKHVFLKGHWCRDEQEYQSFLQHCSRRLKMTHPNVIKMIGYNQHSESQICGDVSKINCYYEYCNLDLEKELEKRKSVSKFFAEQEIWLLLDSLVSVGLYFEQLKIYQGDIRPRNILLTQSGQIKLADSASINQGPNGYARALMEEDRPYLSPLLMEGLRKSEQHPFHNQFKSDVFSVGATMLECCTLQQMCYVFDFEAKQIHFEVLEDMINRLKSSYSMFLTNLIKEMLQKDETIRPSFSEIAGILAPYKQQIQAMTPFNPDYSILKQTTINPAQINSTQDVGGLNLVNQSVSFNNSLATSQIQMQLQPQPQNGINAPLQPYQSQQQQLTQALQLQQQAQFQQSVLIVEPPQQQQQQIYQPSSQRMDVFLKQQEELEREQKPLLQQPSGLQQSQPTTLIYQNQSVLPQEYQSGQLIQNQLVQQQIVSPLIPMMQQDPPITSIRNVSNTQLQQQQQQYLNQQQQYQQPKQVIQQSLQAQSLQTVGSPAEISLQQQQQLNLQYQSSIELQSQLQKQAEQQQQLVQKQQLLLQQSLLPQPQQAELLLQQRQQQNQLQQQQFQSQQYQNIPQQQQQYTQRQLLQQQQQLQQYTPEQQQQLILQQIQLQQQLARQEFQQQQQQQQNQLKRQLPNNEYNLNQQPQQQQIQPPQVNQQLNGVQYIQPNGQQQFLPFPQQALDNNTPQKVQQYTNQLSEQQLQQYLIQQQTAVQQLQQQIQLQKQNIQQQPTITGSVIKGQYESTSSNLKEPQQYSPISMIHQQPENVNEKQFSEVHLSGLGQLQSQQQQKQEQKQSQIPMRLFQDTNNGEQEYNDNNNGNDQDSRIQESINNAILYSNQVLQQNANIQ